jgi:hypothetical protein
MLTILSSPFSMELWWEVLYLPHSQYYVILPSLHSILSIQYSELPSRYKSCHSHGFCVGWSLSHNHNIIEAHAYFSLSLGEKRQRQLHLIWALGASNRNWNCYCYTSLHYTACIKCISQRNTKYDTTLEQNVNLNWRNRKSSSWVRTHRARDYWNLKRARLLINRLSFPYFTLPYTFISLVTVWDTLLYPSLSSLHYPGLTLPPSSFQQLCKIT